jgi:uncharacterized protein
MGDTTDSYRFESDLSRAAGSARPSGRQQWNARIRIGAEIELTWDARDAFSRASLVWRTFQRMGERTLNAMRAVIHPKGVSVRNVTSGRIEIERDGLVGFLEYSLDGNVLELIHTEVPPALRGMGLASALAEKALNWAREKNYRVDIICPFVRQYVSQHPEYSDLLLD